MLGALRKFCPALKEGDFLKAQYDYNCVSYLRVCDDGELFVMVNPSQYDIVYWLLPDWENDAVLYGDITPENGMVRVPKYSAAIMGRGEWTRAFSAYCRSLR